MKTIALVLAAAFLSSPVAHAKRAPAERAASSKKAKPRYKTLPPKEGWVVNIGHGGKPFYSKHRVLSAAGRRRARR